MHRFLPRPPQAAWLIRLYYCNVVWTVVPVPFVRDALEKFMQSWAGCKLSSFDDGCLQGHAQQIRLAMRGIPNVRFTLICPNRYCWLDSCRTFAFYFNALDLASVFCLLQNNLCVSFASTVRDGRYHTLVTAVFAHR